MVKSLAYQIHLKEGLNSLKIKNGVLEFSYKPNHSNWPTLVLSRPGGRQSSSC